MFIILEGPNGAGKTSLLARLKRNGIDTLSSPNGTDLAQILRPMCRGEGRWSVLDKRVKLLCFSAARMDEYIRRVHDSKGLIVADRWWTSTYVYQIVLENQPLVSLESTIHDEERIDAVVTLDAQDDILVKRVRDERLKNPSHGNCTWIQQDETIKKIASIYRKELKEYLRLRNIKTFSIDTSALSQDDVFKEFMMIAAKLA